MMLYCQHFHELDGGLRSLMVEPFTLSSLMQDIKRMEFPAFKGSKIKMDAYNYKPEVRHSRYGYSMTETQIPVTPFSHAFRYVHIVVHVRADEETKIKETLNDF